MSINISLRALEAYSVSTPVFEGPLDLLLQLIERAQLDITKLALAQVTDQYLQHLRLITERSAEEVSAFLVIASKLLQIKSEALLPRPIERVVGEEDPGEALAMQLIHYRKVRSIAEKLGEREASHYRTYIRLTPPPKMTSVVDLSGLGIRDLFEAAKEALANVEHRLELNTVIAAPKITIREKIGLIASLLKRSPRTTFRSFVKDAKSRLEVVVTFLAVLELIKRFVIDAYQESMFGEIEVYPTDSWENLDDLELEFGE